MKNLQLNVVLVRTLYESNIGASARAMANMGANQLYLVDPKCEVGLKAHQGAASAQSVLENRKVLPDLNKLIEAFPHSVWISLCGQDGRGRLAQPLPEVVSKIENRWDHPEGDSKLENVFLIFGPEDWGLQNHDLIGSQFICKLPTFGQNASLNLAQAVLLSLFIFRQSRLKFAINEPPKQTEVAKSGTEGFPEKALRDWLTELGMDVTSPRTNALTTMRRFLQRQWPTEKELSILNIVIQQSLRKLKEYNKMRSSQGLPIANSVKKKNR